MSDEGITDGEAWRIYNYSDFHPRLIRVESPNIPIRFVAYAKKGSKIKGLNGWGSLGSLVDKNIIINTRRGQSRTQEQLKKHGYTLGKNWQFINRVEPAVRKLLSSDRRVDIYIDVDWLVEQVVKENNIEGIYEAGVMETLETYLFLHDKHKKLVPKITEKMSQLHDEGLIPAWVKEAKNNN